MCENYDCLFEAETLLTPLLQDRKDNYPVMKQHDGNLIFCLANNYYCVSARQWCCQSFDTKR